MIIPISELQIQKKFKHAGDFGILGNYNLQTAATFAAAIQAHVQKPGVQEIAGTYRSQPVKHYFDPLTNLNVIVDARDNFVSGWKLNSAQVVELTTTGDIGGG
ncbi:MAG TPA: colicin D domain-containing protein [Kamptonema sp.]|nr:colicin D domain-containing protein [Kamptonema sp.]